MFHVIRQGKVARKEKLDSELGLKVAKKKMFTRCKNDPHDVGANTGDLMSKAVIAGTRPRATRRPA